MKLSIELGPDAKKIISEVGAMGKSIAEAVSSGLSKGVKLASGKVVTEHLSGQDLATRTGNLKRAVDGWMEAAFDGVVGVRESAAVDKYKYLLGTEQVTITPKKGKYLAIPIGAGLTASGVARYSSPRQVPDGFFFTSKMGGLFFGKKFGKTDKSIKALFTFKKSVVVTGSGALAAGVLDSVDDITKEIGSEIDRRTK